MLAKIVPEKLTWDQLIKLRTQIENVVIEPIYYDTLFEWMWHKDAAIARAVRTILLFISDFNLRVEIFTRLAQVDSRDVPFTITYNREEQEFSIELPRIPGWGVSHYSHDSPQTDRMLEVLERLYRKIHPGDIPPYFRS